MADAAERGFVLGEQQQDRELGVNLLHLDDTRQTWDLIRDVWVVAERAATEAQGLCADITVFTQLQVLFV